MRVTDLLTVDCLLPPQVRQLGTRISYLAPRRAVRTSGTECAVRGGEYVSYDRADFRSALAVWLPLAEEEDAKAQTYVGEIYEKGLGTRADYKTAALWYKRAADKGYARAQLNLGFLYETGLGVERDLPRALNLYRQAAGFNNANLQFVSSIEVAERDVTERKTAADHSARLSAQVTDLQQQISDRNVVVESQQQQIRQAEQNISTLQQQLDSRGAEQASNDALLNNTPLKDTPLIETPLIEIPLVETPLNDTPLPHASGPSINIIEPPVLLTRGLPTLSGSSYTAPTLIGRIEPADSLYAFTINGRDYPVSETGMFRFDQTPSAGESLQLLAIDNSGASTRLNLQMPDSDTPTLPLPATTESATVTAAASASTVSLAGIEFGEYHALIIGNDTYESLGKLRTATNDAIDVERILREKYGFRTVLLLNANQQTTLTALERMRATLGEQDNLVIYYAGHGTLDPQTGRGYWLPTDAQPDNKQYWIANSEITAMIDSMAAKHILVIADSCYSGTLTRSSVARALPKADSAMKRKWLQAITRSRVRTVLSSGGLNPVLDGLPNSKHSVFAGLFIQALEDNTDVLETYDLFYQLQQPVANAAAAVNMQQVPQYAPIRHAGHQAGEFVFVPLTRIAAN